MPCCSVISCKNKSGANNLSRGGISYHRFPNDPDTKAEWVLATGRRNWVPGKTATICSIHFEPCDFLKKEGGRHYLYPVAVPSRNLVALQQTLPNPNGRVPPQTTLNNGVNSIEVEITPENSVIVNSQVSQQDTTLHDTGAPFTLSYSRTCNDENKTLIELMQAKIREQALLIRKLKVRNYRLKKRLFSLKSMES